MKRSLPMSQWLRVVVTLLLSFYYPVSVSAQTFNPPFSVEQTYPGFGSGNVGLTGHTSAYSMDNVMNPSPARNLVLAGWDDVNPAEPARVSWQFLLPSLTVWSQGIIPYTNVRDLEVGFLDVSGSQEVLVAYYENGVGHKLDVYRINTGVPVYLYTKVLSTMTTYTRISMDCHLRYGMVVAWEDVDGIRTVVGHNAGPSIIFSAPLTLSGTLGETTVDVAFSHKAASLAMQYVYYNPYSGNITESQFDYWTAIYLTSWQYVNPTVNDINMVGTCRPCDGNPSNIPVIHKCPYPNIDCPGHDNDENWAYTYTVNNADIAVRLKHVPTSTIATRIVNNGSILPSMSINTDQNVHPVLSYDRKCNQMQQKTITVGWHTTAIDPNSLAVAGYVALAMNEMGNALFSMTDYLTVANNPTMASITPVMAMSKQDDFFAQLYTVFPEYNSILPGYRMEHKYPNFCTNSYKPALGSGNQQEEVMSGEHFCDDGKKIAEFKRLHGLTTVNTSPNPFTTKFDINIPVEYWDKDATMLLSTVLGATIVEYKGSAKDANAYFESKVKSLPAGSYFLNINIGGEVKETLKLSKSE